VERLRKQRHTLLEQLRLAEQAAAAAAAAQQEQQQQQGPPRVSRHELLRAKRDARQAVILAAEVVVSGRVCGARAPGASCCCPAADWPGTAAACALTRAAAPPRPLRPQLCTLSASGGDLKHAFPPGAAPQFDVVVVDEAANALEPATLIPLQLIKPGGVGCTPRRAVLLTRRPACMHNTHH
jgi:senataxin